MSGSVLRELEGMISPQTCMTRLSCVPRMRMRLPGGTWTRRAVPPLRSRSSSSWQARVLRHPRNWRLERLTWCLLAISHAMRPPPSWESQISAKTDKIPRSRIRLLHSVSSRQDPELAMHAVLRSPCHEREHILGLIAIKQFEMDFMMKQLLMFSICRQVPIK